MEILARPSSQEKEIKAIMIEEREVKLPLFGDDIILYIENLWNPTKNY